MLYSHQFELKWSEPVNLIQLNSSSDDFAPSWNKFSEKLYFNSERSGKTIFYLTELNDSTGFTNTIRLENGLNRGDNNSYISFYSENEALISSYQNYSRRSYQNIFQIFEKRKEWTKPVFVESLGFEGFVSHPSISPSGKLLVFSSSRESQNNELNLWMAFRQDNGTYTNLSQIKELNTLGDEITPFFASEDTLFFASNGQEGPGGFDIFYSIFKEGIWTQPIPISAINTKFDESDFVILPGGKCIFASDRPGGKGKLDLYQTNLTKKLIQQNRLESEIELSIATQVSSIKMNYDIVYKTFILNPVFSADPKFKDQYNSMLDSSNTDTLKIQPTLADVTKNTIAIIGERMKGNFTALLTIKINKNINTDYSEKLKDLLQQKWNISASRILIEKDDLGSDLAMTLESNDKSILAPINIGSTEFNFEPKMLEILLNARPVDMIKSWVLQIQGSSAFEIDKGKSLPYQINLDLQKIKYQMLNLDSLTLVLGAEESDGINSFQKSVINLSQSESRRKDLLKTGKKFFEQIDIFCPQKLTIESEFFSFITKYLNENTKPNNPITILCYDDSELPNLLILKNWLISNFQSKNITDGGKLDGFSNLKIDKSILPFTISILIEKGDF